MTPLMIISIVFMLIAIALNAGKKNLPAAMGWCVALVWLLAYICK